MSKSVNSIYRFLFLLEMFVKYRILTLTRAVDVRLGYFTVLK